MYHRCMRSLVSTSWQVAHRNVTVSIGSSFFSLFVYCMCGYGVDFGPYGQFWGAYVFHFSCSRLFSFLCFYQLPCTFRQVRARCHLSLYREAHYNYYHTSSGRWQTLTLPHALLHINFLCHFSYVCTQGVQFHPCLRSSKVLWVETQPGDGATIPRGKMQTHNITHIYNSFTSAIVHE